MCYYSVWETHEIINSRYLFWIHVDWKKYNGVQYAYNATSNLRPEFEENNHYMQSADANNIIYVHVFLNFTLYVCMSRIIH